jgi:hypothetical protein
MEYRGHIGEYNIHLCYQINGDKLDDEIKINIINTKTQINYSTTYDLNLMSSYDLTPSMTYYYLEAAIEKYNIYSPYKVEIKQYNDDDKYILLCLDVNGKIIQLQIEKCNVSNNDLVEIKIMLKNIDRRITNIETFFKKMLEYE